MATIPSLSSKPTNAELQKFARAVKTYIEGGNSVSAAYVAGQITSALDGYDPVDLTKPGPPKYLEAHGGFNSILLTWGEASGPVFGYEIARNTIDDLGNAVIVSPVVAGLMWSDTPPDSRLSVVYYYWVRAVSKEGIRGDFNATAGTPGSTADEPRYLLEVLTAEIKEGQLYGDLNDRIDLIEVNGTAITTLQELRESDLEAFASQVDTLSAGIGGNSAAIQTEQTTRATADGALASSITTLQVTVGSNTTALQTKAEVSDLNAVYEVKADANGRVTGFGMVADAASTEFGIIADRFWIIDPDDDTSTLVPFVVDNGKVHIANASIIDITNENFVGKKIVADEIVAAVSLASPVISGGTITGTTITGTDLIGTNSITGGSITGTTFNNGSGTFVVDANGGVTAKNLVIKNSAGQIILSSGTGAEWSYVNGRPTSLAGLNSTEGAKLSGIASGADVTSQNTAYNTNRVNGTAASTVVTNASNGATFTSSNAGNLAYRSSIDYDSSYISGTKPPVDADKTSSNKSYDTYRVGGTTSVVTANNKITSSNISTYIADLAVDTLQIKGDAVTVPVSAQNDASLSITLTENMSDYWTTVLSFPMDSGGQPIHVITTANVYAHTQIAMTMKIRYLVGGSVVLTRTLHDVYNNLILDYYYDEKSFSVVDKLTGTTGSQTIYVQMSVASGNGSGQSCTLSARRTVALGVKR